MVNDSFWGRESNMFQDVALVRLPRYELYSRRVYDSRKGMRCRVLRRLGGRHWAADISRHMVNIYNSVKE